MDDAVGISGSNLLRITMPHDDRQAGPRTGQHVVEETTIPTSNHEDEGELR